MDIKYCENCGAAMPVESKFCTECGTPFPKADKKEAKPAEKPDQLEKTESPLDALMTRPEDSPAFPPENQPGQPWEPPVSHSADRPVDRPADRPADNPPVQSSQSGWNGQINPAPNSSAPNGSAPNSSAPNGSAPNSSDGPWNHPENGHFSQNQSVPDPAFNSTITEAPPVQNQPIPTIAYGPANTVRPPVGVGGGAYDQGRAVNDEELRGTPLEPVSAWGWLGILLLMDIPLVRLVLVIVWACGGCRKNAKKSFARGMLLYNLVAILFLVLFVFLLLFVLINIPAVESILNDILGRFGYYIV